ncbi:hypothetical protein Sjap_013838 [Stephania japonica]|uniref:Uncharacterized protein n=1 Tax=Stephania japonica TaxID=461633 RepID=A0AAP0IYN3_9MAGN
MIVTNSRQSTRPRRSSAAAPPGQQPTVSIKTNKTRVVLWDPAAVVHLYNSWKLTLSDDDVNVRLDRARNWFPKLATAQSDNELLRLVTTSRGVWDILKTWQHELGCRKTLEAPSAGDIARYAVEPVSHDVSHCVQTGEGFKSDALYDAARDFPTS